MERTCATFVCRRFTQTSRLLLRTRFFFQLQFAKTFFAADLTQRRTRLKLPPELRKSMMRSWPCRTDMKLWWAKEVARYRVVRRNASTSPEQFSRMLRFFCSTRRHPVSIL